MKTAEIYRLKETARARFMDALNRGVRDDGLEPLRAEYLRLNQLIEQAKAAARSFQ